jgi:hypothetical protein
MSYEGQQDVQRELRGSERLLWSGTPPSGLRLQSADLLIVPFSLLWGGFVVFWEYSVVSQRNAPRFMALFGIPFVLVGAYMVFGRFFFDAFQRSRTAYGLTDQRIIIVTRAFGRQVKSLTLSALSETSVRERDDKSGTITLGPSSGATALFGGSGWSGRRYAPPALVGIENVRSVYDQILAAQEAAQRPELHAQ